MLYMKQQKQIQRIYIQTLIQACKEGMNHSHKMGKRIALNEDAKRAFYQLGATFKLFMSDIGQSFGLNDMDKWLPEISKGTIQRLFFTKDAYHFNISNLDYVLKRIQEISDDNIFKSHQISVEASERFTV